MSTAATFIEPKLSLRYTQYALMTIHYLNPAQIEFSQYLVWIVVSFWNEKLLFQHGLLQTLEPRLYYLSLPHDGQEDLPVFDTGLYTFSFDSLFYSDRFSRPDRVGDANQITLAVTSQLINQNTDKSLGSLSLWTDILFS